MTMGTPLYGRRRAWKLALGLSFFAFAIPAAWAGRIATMWTAPLLSGPRIGAEGAMADSGIDTFPAQMQCTVVNVSEKPLSNIAVILLTDRRLAFPSDSSRYQCSCNGGPCAQDCAPSALPCLQGQGGAYCMQLPCTPATGNPTLLPGASCTLSFSVVGTCDAGTSRCIGGTRLLPDRTSCSSNHDCYLPLETPTRIVDGACDLEAAPPACTKGALAPGLTQCGSDADCDVQAPAPLLCGVTGMASQRQKMSIRGSFLSLDRRSNVLSATATFREE